MKFGLMKFGLMTLSISSFISTLSKNSPQHISMMSVIACIDMLGVIMSIVVRLSVMAAIVSGTLR